MTRFVFISDTHRYHPELPDGDVLVHAGDLTWRGQQDELREELEWLGDTSYRRIFVVPGNHDHGFQQETDYWKSEADRLGINLVLDEIPVVDGISMFFSPWTPIFGNWAFMHSSERAEQYWNCVHYADIWVTHGPPYGMYDQCPQSVGCPHLAAAVARERPKVHVFGHIHEGGGGMNINTDTGTLSLNVSVLDGKYNPRNYPPRVFDIEPGWKHIKPV